MTGYFTSYAGQKYQVTVGNASGTLYMGEDPVHLTWDRPDHIFVSLRTMSANIRVKSSIDLSSFYTDDPLGCPVRIDAVDSSNVVTSCVFFGYLVPQEWEAPFSGLNDEVELMAVDALAALKNIRFTYSSTSPMLVSSSSLLSRAIAIIGVTSTDYAIPYTQANINEEAFLPTSWDDSEYSDGRKTWAEVIAAIGTWQYLTFFMDGDILCARNIETLVGNTPTVLDLRGEDSASSDIRFSIEPAKAYIKVNYDNLEEMSLLPDIAEQRMDGTPLSSSTVGSAETVTYSEFFAAKDWVPTDSRSGCGAVVYAADDSETACIVGPAYIKVSARHFNTRVSDNRGIKFTMQAWARNDMTVNADGYEELAVHTSPSNFNPVVYIESDAQAIAKTLQIEGQEGFASCGAAIFPNDSADFTGVINISVPEHCAITNLKVELQERAYNTISGRWEKLSEVENDGIVVLKSSGYNDSLSIDATLRACAHAWSPCDVVGDVALGWNKFPFCKTEQFAVPRKRIKAVVSSVVSPLALISDSNVSSQKMLVDGGDIDLRQDETTLDLIETWVSV